MTEQNGSIFGSLPPPREEDDLFCGNREDWKLNACIDHWGDVDHAYIIGFHDAALKLAEDMCEKPIGQDTKVYPIIYLYRHHIEILLKRIVRLLMENLNQEISNRIRRMLQGHDLQKLWYVIESRLGNITAQTGCDDIPTEDIAGVRSYIQKLHEHDPKSVSFRYGRERNGDRTLKKDVLRINIRSFAVRMETLSRYLSGVESWLDQLTDFHRSSSDL